MPEHPPSSASETMPVDRAALAVVLDQPWARSILEENPEVIALFRAVLDPDGRFIDAAIVSVNRAARDRWFEGRSEAELAGRQLFAEWPHLRPIVFDPYREAVEERRRVRRELHIVWQHLDIWSELTVHPFEGGFTHISRDVTDARRAAIESAAAEERFRLALDSATETIAMYRPVLDDEGRLDDLEVVFANRVARERWLGGAAHEEAQGRLLFATWPELRARTFELYRQVVETGEPYAGPWTAPPEHGGRTFDLRITAYPGGLVHTSMDVTERVRAGEQLQSLADTLELRVQERTADLEAFTRTASHDLRAPIRAIHGFSTIVRRRYGDLLDDEGRHYLDNIAQSSLAMGDLLEDLLEYARMGRRAVRSEPVELCQVLEPVMRTLRDQLRATRASLTVVEPLATLVGDPTLLGSILVNLVGNACTYHRPGVPPVVRVAAIRDGESVEVSVSDEGIGIPPDQTEAIFEVFTRLHSADDYPGSGIGLSIVRRAARLMGTEVTVDSEPGRGTTFRLRLPAAGPAATDRPS